MILETEEPALANVAGDGLRHGARGMRGGHRKARIDAVVEICALADVIYKPIAKLSKGYRQRVGMAQALIHEPEVLILDEPTSGLDPNQIRGVRATMRRLGEEKTILLSTHILQEVKAMASRVILINEGRKVYDGMLEDMDRDGRGLDVVFAELTGHDPVTGVRLQTAADDEQADGPQTAHESADDTSASDES